VKRLCLLLFALALAAPVAAVAGGRPRPPHATPPRLPPRSQQSSAQSVAAALCVSELKQLGETAFEAKYATRGACLQAHADQASQIVASCASVADPRACVRAAAGEQDGKAVSRPRRDQVPRLVPKVAAALCRAERRTLGADGFKQKYPSTSTCLQQMKEKATALVEAAQEQCATDKSKARCVQAALAQALGLPAATSRK
jgi:hypothetical protein